MPAKKEILRIRGDIKATYARISRVYDAFKGRFERKLRGRGLELLDIKEGEAVLEIGFGTGYLLIEIARSVGKNGKVSGIDLTSQMVSLAKARVQKEGLAERVELREGDAREMPYQNKQFDVVFMTAMLELFDKPDTPKVLAEIKRVLKPAGRQGHHKYAQRGS